MGNIHLMYQVELYRYLQKKVYNDTNKVYHIYEIDMAHIWVIILCHNSDIFDGITDD